MERIYKLIECDDTVHYYLANSVFAVLKNFFDTYGEDNTSYKIKTITLFHSCAGKEIVEDKHKYLLKLTYSTDDRHVSDITYYFVGYPDNIFRKYSEVTYDNHKYVVETMEIISKSVNIAKDPEDEETFIEIKND